MSLHFGLSATEIWRFAEWSRRAPSDIDGKPRMVSELAQAN
jgi:hypothetical protein